MKNSDGLDFLRDWPADKLQALYRVANRTGFFNDPRQMIKLRSIVHGQFVIK